LPERWLNPVKRGDKMNKHLPLLFLGVIAVLAIGGLVKFMNTETTGNYVYAGGQIQYDTTDVCTQVQCQSGPAQYVKADSSNYAQNFMLASCRCPETPGVLYTVKFIKPIQSYGY